MQIELKEDQYLSALIGVVETATLFDFEEPQEDTHPIPRYAIWRVNNGEAHDLMVHLNGRVIGHEYIELTEADFQRDVNTVIQAVHVIVAKDIFGSGYRLLTTAL